MMKTTAEKTQKPASVGHQPFFSGNGSKAHAQTQDSFFEPVSSFALGNGAMVQAQLEVGAVDSPAEVEADSIADQVMRKPDSDTIRRNCSNCETKEKLKRSFLFERILMKASGKSLPISNYLNNRIQSARGGGSSLDSSTQNFMSSRFGTDFSNVRVHTDSNAVQMSRELNAHAFTVGNDVFFNQGKYNPHSGDGKRLLAHELTHVVQQQKNIVIQRAAPAAAAGVTLGAVVAWCLSGAAGSLILDAVVQNIFSLWQRGKVSYNYCKGLFSALFGCVFGMAGGAIFGTAGGVTIREFSKWIIKTLKKAGFELLAGKWGLIFAKTGCNESQELLN